MNFITIIGAFIGCILGGLAFEGFSRGFVRYRRPIIYKWEWKDINDVPIPDDADGVNEILYFDGKEVGTLYYSIMKYNSQGKPFHGSGRIITHWAYLPSAPILEYRDMKTGVQVNHKDLQETT